MARSLGYLDWATQPDPFRRFEGALGVDLVGPLADATTRGVEWQGRAYDALFDAAARPLLDPGLPAVSVFLRFSLGLSAWKAVPGSRWALRVNPSSGNLHPTEGYVVLPPGVTGAEAGVWHYRPDTHAMERRCAIDPARWADTAGSLPTGAFLAALSSIHWREAWKYGERAFRYCQHDTGHAIAAMRMAAAMMGWHARVLTGWDAAALSAMLGLDRDADFGAAEREEPECVLLLSRTPITNADPDRLAGLKPCPTPDGCPALASACARGTWSGRANRLSADHVEWEAIDDVADATREIGEILASQKSAPASGGQPEDAALPSDRAVAASRLFLQRRSAQAMSGDGSLDLDVFCGVLRRLLPGAAPPWDTFPFAPRLHLVLFVHRVHGLEPGLYAFPRTPSALDVLHRELHDDFAWIRPTGVPDDLPLYLLTPTDVRRAAAALSCQQAIASDGCFSVAMFAEFDAALAADGAPAYRHLFWEAGAIGHLLYLEAEAAGVRGTGIGCYFDDSVHELLGIDSHVLQSLYHFTVGHCVDDPRLQTEPGYAWERSPRD